MTTSIAQHGSATARRLRSPGGTRLKQLATIATLILLVLGCTPPATVVTSSTCPEHFPGGAAPALTNPKLGASTHEICYAAFAVLHSGVTRTPLWAAEHLTREHVVAAGRFERRNTFHAEPRLPEDERARLIDYERSGYDRGHLAPSEDMPDPEAQYESFSLANIVPQEPDLNRRLWAEIEVLVRRLAQDQGELYVVTGPLFQGATLKRLNGRVLAPSGLFKAVYDPKRRQAAAYLAPNVAGGKWEVVSLAELAQVAGIDPFPGLSAAVKKKAMELPVPTP